MTVKPNKSKIMVMTVVPSFIRLLKDCGVNIHQKIVVAIAVKAITRDVGPAPYCADAKNK